MKDSTKKTMTTVRFEGPRFEDHGLDLDVLSELSAYKKLILETAKELWWSEHPDSERLPKGFRHYFSVKMYGIHPGAVTVDLVRTKPNPDDQLDTLFESEDAFDKAAVLIEETIAAMASGVEIPDSFPIDVIPLFKDLGATLREDESISAKSPHRMSPSRFDRAVRERFLNWQGPSYENDIDLIGEVRNADLDEGSFSVRLTDGKKIDGKFSPEQEKSVLSALLKHDAARLRIVGRGEYDRKSETLVKLVQVDSITLVPALGKGYNDKKPSKKDIVTDNSTGVSDEEWSKVPQDLAVLLDSYQDGTSEDPS
jgi:hypothetical protein